jgi:PKHD-type hydroxylase
MILIIGDVLQGSDLTEILRALSNATFVDGRTTAGWSARQVKSNLQASNDMAIERARALVEKRLREHPVFALATRPRRVIGPQFAKYTPGHAYGAHVDDAVMDGTRTDVSFTIFLSPPDGYDGGELVIESALGEEAFKLEPGTALVYPATMLHRVAPVTRGDRIVAAGWIRSMVRDATHRELLFDLDTARRRLFDREGKTLEGDLLAKCTANLLRMWCDD